MPETRFLRGPIYRECSDFLGLGCRVIKYFYSVINYFNTDRFITIRLHDRDDAMGNQSALTLSEYKCAIYITLKSKKFSCIELFRDFNCRPVGIYIPRISR